MWYRICIILFFLGLFLFYLTPVNSGDFFHHINTGRYIFENRSLPYTDTWSYTAFGQPWVAHSWGAGVLFYLSYLVGGFTAISVLFGLVGMLIGVFTYRLLQDLGIPLHLRVLLVSLSTVIISLRFPTRPEIFAPLFVSILLYFLTQFQKRKRWLPFLFWIWGIIYGSSAFLGIGLLCMYLFIHKKWNRIDTVLLFLCFITSLLNGYGFSSFFYVFSIPSIAAHTGEWLPFFAALNPAMPQLYLAYQHVFLEFLGFSALCIVIFAYSFFKERKSIQKNLFFFTIFLSFVLPFFINRFLNLVPVLIVPFLGICITHIMKLKKVFLVFLFCVFLTGVYVKFLQFPPGLGLGEGKFPQKEITFLKKYGIDGNVYANQEISAFITWELSNSKIFVDTRDDLFEPVGVFQKLAHLDAGENLSSVLSAYHADIVIGSVGEGVVYKPLFYNENWKLVEMDGGYFILVKKETQVQKNLEIYESLDPLRVPPVKQGELEKGEQELAKLIEMGFDSAENKVRLIETKLTQGDGLQAKQLLLQLNLEENIGVMQPIYNIESSILKAKVALAAGDCEGVFRLLSKAENESRGKLFFIPKAVIPSNVDRYWGEYYFRCKNDTQKAREYYNQYMQNTSDPLENREIERKLKEL